MNPTLVRKFILPRLMRRTWPEVLRAREALEASQWLPVEELERRQVAGVRALIQRAMVESPYLGEKYRAAGVDPKAMTSLTELSQVPPLEKEEIKNERERILCQDVEPDSLTSSATGGTTGEPTRYWWDDAYWCTSSAVTQRAYGFLGFEPGDRHVMIWGTAFHKTRRAAWKESIQNRLRNLMVVPGFALSPATMRRFAPRAARHHPRIVEGYTSLLVLFGAFLLEEGFDELRPTAVVSSAERLYPFQRDLISRAFGAPVYDRYGTREVGCIAAECAAGDGLHINAEHVIVEIERNGQRAAPGESGEILVTCLSNQAFPFIRYRIGDLGALRASPCPCGRGLPLLDLTEGRIHDILTTSYGSYLPGEFFPHLFKDYLGVKAFRVHQAADCSVTVSIVKSPSWNDQEHESYRSEVAKALGPGTSVAYDFVDEIERTAAGKLRFTSSDVPVDLIKQQVQGRTAAS